MKIVTVRLHSWTGGQPGQVGNQAALTVEPVLGSRLVTSHSEVFLLVQAYAELPAKSAQTPRPNRLEIKNRLG